MTKRGTIEILARTQAAADEEFWHEMAQYLDGEDYVWNSHAVAETVDMSTHEQGLRAMVIGWRVTYQWEAV